MKRETMSLSNDPLADALNRIKVHKNVGQSECTLKPASKLIREVLALLQTHNYIGEFEFVDDGKSGEFKLRNIGSINDCGVIKPRFSVKKSEWSKWEQRFIPSKDFGFLIVTTPQGLMTNHEARKRGIGGKLIAYVY